VKLIQPPNRWSVRGVPRAACALLALIVAASSALAPARAAGEASDVVVEVVDASTNAPVPLARVLLQGEAGAVGYTDADGRARFESVATGSYRAGVSKRGFDAARSPLFDVAANRTSTVRVRLARTGSLKKIGSISVTSSPARATREVGQDDALRFLDGSLRGAIGDLPGVTSAGDGFAIDGNDPSQTGTSIDGVPIPGAGGGLADRGINADLFGGASVSSGAANGALGGSVNFRTLQPTRLPQQQATLQYASDDSSSALVLARGSVRNLGYVVEHAVRGRTSALTGLDFLDQTGFAYRHDADRVDAGNLLKLRWAPSIAQSLTFTASSTNGANGLACAQLTALFPCGFGPNAFTSARGGLMTLSESATIGATSVSASAFVNGSVSTTNEPARALAGVAAPQSSDFRSLARGFAFGAQLPGGQRHDLSISAQSFGLQFSGSTTTAFATFPLAQSTTFHGVALTDRYHPDQRLTITGRAGSSASNGSSAFTTALDVRWQPIRSLAYDVAASAGDVGSGLVVSGTAFPEPSALTFDCAHGLAYGTVPSANAAHQRSSSVRASAERSGRRGRLVVTAWSTRLQNAPVLAAVDATTLGLPPGYLASVNAFGASPFVCGSAAVTSVAFTSFQPAHQVNRGATLAGTLETGKALIAGFVGVQSRFVTNATPATLALTPPGAQVPDTPLHRAGLVATAKLGKSVDVLANLSYTSANNPNRLPPYTLFNAGFATPLREGSLALVGTNLGNLHAGPFIAPSGAVAFARAGAPPLALAATPLAPRAVALTYTVRTGRVGAAGSGAGTTEATAEPQGEGVTVRIHVTEMREGVHPDALQIDPDNDACTPAAARIAQPAMDAMGKIAGAAERAKANGRYPATIPGGKQNVAGVALTYLPYDDRRRFVVTVEGELRLTAAFLNCAHLSMADPDQRETFHTYIPPAPASGSPRPSRFFIAYAPPLGIYMVPQSIAAPGTSRVTASATIEDEPATAPATPFALRTTCPSSSKPVADAIVAAVMAAREAQRAGATPAPVDVAEVAVHGSGAQSWIELQPRDAFAQVAAIQCLHVAGVSREHLQGAGIKDDRRPGNLGFTERFGFYVIARQAAPPTPSP
jgi:Carboxypeptidase regulatory-like domain